MSVTLVTNETLNVIAWAGQGTGSRDSGAFLGRYASLVNDYAEHGHQTRDTTAKLAKMLAYANGESYSNRYEDEDAQQTAIKFYENYVYQAPKDTGWSAPEIFLIIRDLEYNLTEADNYGAGHPAHDYLSALKEHLINRMTRGIDLYGVYSDTKSMNTQYREEMREAVNGQNAVKPVAPKYSPLYS